ncbi:murein hydrolase activator EnvC [Allorhizobium sp. BGMRC 0089]|nr:murein hydrolase activator EnvC [Allorhizobium sonneratiae]MCM2294333.1 murein hydrolase activator EnvC [Allorhizobium sonneratiae]
MAEQPTASPAETDSKTSTATSEPTSPDTSSSNGTANLQAKRDEISAQLADIAQSLQVSAQKTDALRQSIDTLDKSSANLRQALIDSAARRQDLEQKISDSEQTLADYAVKEDTIRQSFRQKRGVLAEVLGALERMGRNPPPALLVKPDDALSAVRTAILLGSVVPGIRKQTDKLASDLASLAKLRAASEAEHEKAVAALKSRQEEESRMNMLLAENARQSAANNAALQSELQRAQELAQKSSSMQGLIASLESNIGSVRQSMADARQAEAQRQGMTEEERRQAATLPPDKNRIAPAFAFDDLKAKLAYPAAGAVLRRFGDPDGTGHDAKGMILATAPSAVVTAPSDATVVYAGQFRSYGQMIILNPGKGYHIVLSGMERVNVHAGQFVLAGEPIGAMGMRRVASAAAFALETDRPTLYIEFRKDGNAVDSRPWWAKDAGKVRNDT